MTLSTFIKAGLSALAMTLAQPTFADGPAGYRVLIYGDSNTWGYVPTESGFASTRLPNDQRFAGVVQTALGDDFEIVVNGLQGRTTNLDFPKAFGNLPVGAFNGAETLPAAIAEEMPLDLVVIALGANDLQAWTGRSADDIAVAAMELAKIVRDSRGVATNYPAPDVLVLTPPSLGLSTHEEMQTLFAGGLETSQDLAEAFEAAGAASNVRIFDTGAAIGVPSGGDGVHFSAEDHAQLGVALVPVILGVSAETPRN